MFGKIAITGAVLAAMVGSAAAAPDTATMSHSYQGGDHVRGAPARDMQTNAYRGSLITPPAKTPNYSTPRQSATSTLTATPPISHFVK